MICHPSQVTVSSWVLQLKLQRVSNNCTMYEDNPFTQYVYLCIFVLSARLREYSFVFLLALSLALSFSFPCFLGTYSTRTILISSWVARIETDYFLLSEDQRRRVRFSSFHVEAQISGYALILTHWCHRSKNSWNEFTKQIIKIDISLTEFRVVALNFPYGLILQLDFSQLHFLRKPRAQSFPIFSSLRSQIFRTFVT